MTPESHDPTTETFTLNTGVALFTLDSGLDYEVNTGYSVVMEVVDPGKTPPSTGTITIKVRNNVFRNNYCQVTKQYLSIATITV
jgi:hypothetical protein